MRESPLIPLGSLRALLHDHYHLDARSLTFLPVGDTHSAIYRADTASESFLLKLRTSFDDARLRSARFLHDHGVQAVIAPLPTATGALSAPIDGWDAVAFPYVEGKTGWDTITDAHWNETGRISRHIHSLLPEDIPGLHRETFDISAYAAAVKALETQITSPGDAAEPVRRLATAWRKHQGTVHRLVGAMEYLTDALKAEALPLVICHADLHPGNLLRDTAGNVFVIDWDDVMLALKERDFIFTGEPGTSPFFDGYGPVDLDWRAVTYYRYERVVTDLIAYGSDVFDDSLSEATKLLSVERFVVNFEGASFAAALRAADRLPPGLGRIPQPD